MTTSPKEAAIGEVRRALEPEDHFIDDRVHQNIDEQARNLSSAVASLEQVWDRYPGSPRQKIGAVTDEMRGLAYVLNSALERMKTHGAYITLQPLGGSVDRIKVVGGAEEAVTTCLPMVVDCFYKERREGMRVIPDKEREEFMRKLLDGKTLRIVYRSNQQ